MELHEYMHLVQTTSKNMKDHEGFACDMFPDQKCAYYYYSLIKTRNRRAETHFARALPTTFNMIMYRVLDNIIETNQETKCPLWLHVKTDIKQLSRVFSCKPSQQRNFLRCISLWLAPWDSGVLKTPELDYVGSCWLPTWRTLAGSLPEGSELQRAFWVLQPPPKQRSFFKVLCSF